MSAITNQGNVQNQPIDSSPYNRPTTISGPNVQNGTSAENSGCYQRFPNMRSSAGSMLLLYSSGLNLAWNIWQVDITQAWSTDNWIFYNTGLYSFVLYSWFLFASVGSIVGSVLVGLWNKRDIYNLCGALLALAGLLFSIWGGQLLPVLVARIISGTAHGILYVTIVTHTGENSTNEMRGRQLSVFAVILTAAALTVTACTYIDFLTVDGYASFAERKIGFVMLVFTVVGVALNTYRTHESVHFLLHRGRQYEAEETLMKIREEKTLTQAIQNELDEIRLLLSQDKMESRNIISNGNVRPVLLLILLKLKTVVTNNAIINMMLTYITVALLGPSVPTSLCTMILTGSRFLMTIIPIFVGDKYGRRWLQTWSGASAAIMLLIFIILLMAFQEMIGFIILLLLFQGCLGFGIEPMHHVYTSEAFSINKKALSIAFVSSVEYVLQILAIFGMHFIEAPWNPFVLITAIVMLVIAAILRIMLPETRGLSLRKCRDVFRNVKPVNDEARSGHDLINN